MPRLKYRKYGRSKTAGACQVVREEADWILQEEIAEMRSRKGCDKICKRTVRRSAGQAREAKKHCLRYGGEGSAIRALMHSRILMEDASKRTLLAAYGKTKKR